MTKEKSDNLLNKNRAEQICRDHEMVKLNLGCGFQKLDGHINIDAVEQFAPDYIYDLSKPLPFPKSSVHTIMAEGIFEHFDKYNRYIIMENWASILIKSGKIILGVPNMDHILSMKGKVHIESIIELIYGENMIQSKNYTWHYGNHKWGYTKETLIRFGNIFGIEFSILTEGGNIQAEGVKVRDIELDDRKIEIYSHGNDYGIGKAYMTLREVKEKIKAVIP